MPPINAAYLEHQLKRWMRPDAHHFVRPDWRRFVRPGFEDDHPFALYERKYSQDQPRVPPGSRDGGQWTGDGSGGGPSTNDSGVDPQKDTSEKIRVAGSVIPICIVETRVLYGDGTYKAIYICADGRTITQTGVGRRFPGIIRQPR